MGIQGRRGTRNAPAILNRSYGGSFSRSAQTLPGLAASVRDATVFMHYMCMNDRSASRERIRLWCAHDNRYAASSRHTCVTRKQTVTPMASGISVATVVHLALRVSLKIV